MGLLIILSIIFTSLISITVLIFIIIPLMFGASYEPSRIKIIHQMLKFSKPKSSDKMVDLGSGDGKIVFEFAKKGIESHGYEINPVLVFWSKRKAKKLNLQNKAFFHWKNFWKADISKFNIVTIFQFYHLMPFLERKLFAELPKGAKILSNKWKFPKIKPENQKGNVYFYKCGCHN